MPDMPVRIVLERGPKGKKAVAFAIDWPGWSRGAKTPDLAVARSSHIASGTVRSPSPPAWRPTLALTPDGLRSHRTTYVNAMRAYNAGEGKRMRTWTLPFLIRHTGYHVMDHAWEMEDKDLSG